MTDDLLSKSEVAIRLNVAPLIVTRLLKDKMLPGVCIRGEWLVASCQLERFMKAEHSASMLDFMRQRYIERITAFNQGFDVAQRQGPEALKAFRKNHKSARL